jgi:DNA-binding NarL/FixJ family response regulator
VTRILVADGLTTLRAAVVSVLAREDDFEVVGAATAAEVGRVAELATLDVALLDLDLPPDGALPAIAAVQSASPHAEIVVWSSRPQADSVFAALRRGATGYLDKDIGAAALVRAIRAAAGGEALLSRDLVALVIEAVHESDRMSGRRDRTSVLSTRERQVLDHIARGARNRQIAGALAISEFTVKRHVQNILRKLELGSRHEAATVYLAAVGHREAVTT